jgi:hypothetical protein
MTPKDPEKLREKLEEQNQEPSEKDRTAEGLEVERPKRDEFFGNLKKVSQPNK